MCEDEEVKAGMEAAVLQPRHSIKSLAIVKLAVHSGHRGGHEQTTDGISKLFVGLATLAAGSSKRKGDLGRDDRAKGEDGVEILTADEGKEKKRRLLRITQAPDLTGMLLRK